MAANCAKRTLSRLTSTSFRAVLGRTSAPSSLPSTTTRLRGLSSPKHASPSRLLPDSLTLSRIPVELGGVLTMMPLHNVTASALLTSLLCLSSESWGCLSEGFATPL